MFGHGIDVCLGTPTTAAMDTSEGEISVKQPLGLEKQVTEEAFGSWMVVERRKGRRWQVKYGNEGAVGSAASKLHFVALNGMKDMIEHEIGSGYGGKDLIADVDLEREDLVADLGMKGKQTNQVDKKKRVVVSGPNVALRSLKPNVGKMGLQQNKAQNFKDTFSNVVSDRFRGSAMGYEQVKISENLKSGSHAAVRFMDNDKVLSKANKENNIFLFGNSSLKQK